MRDYNQKRRSGGGKFGGGGFRRRDSGPREMHKAVCDNCGNDCEVPFKPSGDKPIFCSDCFEKKNGRSFQRTNRSRSTSGGSGFRDSGVAHKQLLEQLSSLNTKLDRILKVVEVNVEKKATPKTIEAKKVTSEKIEIKKVSKKPTEKSPRKINK